MLYNDGEMSADAKTMDLQQILSPKGLLSRKLPGYEYRPQQVEAALTIEQALTAREHCIVEAGTGVGKSMAYLLPAVKRARSGKKTVVSTHTIYLQSQLLTRDIPFLQGMIPGRSFKAVLVKGRGNYLCRCNLDNETGQLLLLGDPAFDRLRQWARETETGDVSELGFSYPYWADVCSDQDTCHHQECRFFDKCFYYRMRRAAQEADIVVTNHSLFLSDLSIRMADPKSGILPDYDAVIFDEAHHLEDVATKVFGIEFSNWRVPSLLNRVRRTRGIALDPGRIQAIEELNGDLFGLFSSFSKPEFFFEDVYDTLGREPVEDTALKLCGLLDGLNRELAEQDLAGQPQVEERVNGLKRICTRLKEELSLLFFGPSEERFRWGERPSNSRFVNCFLRSSPVTVADVLQESLWKTLDTAVLTSATLSNSGTFGYIKSRLGLRGCREVIEDSPFDFQTQCMLYVPRHLDFPSDSPVYADQVAEEIRKIVLSSNGRAFLLFTSYRMLNAVHDRLCGQLPFAMLKQGDMSNEQLVKTFLGEASACLFGVHSFWEGVDIRGEALSCVVIDRLPFAVPDSPVNRARVDAIKEAGGDWFRQYAMPQAQMRLKQGFGRLIRTKNDRGVVAILDSRLVKKFYGREFLRFLPQCPVTSQMEDIRHFYEGG